MLTGPNNPGNNINPGIANARIGITGATGFVGGQLCAHLQQQGARLRLLVRSTPSTLATEIAAASELVHGALEDAAAVQEFTRGCDAVVHCAASVRGASRQDFHLPNVIGTRHLLNAMQQSQCNYLLHISTIAASQPQLSWYSGSKYAAEQLVQESGIPALILRAPAIYGPGDRALRPLLDMLYKGGLVIRVTAAEQRLALVHVDDLCAAIVQSLRQRLQGLFSIDDGNEQGYDWQTLCATVGSLSGKPVHSIALPAALLHTLAYGNLYWSRWRGSKPIFNPGKARELRWADWRAASPRLQQVLDWQPRLCLAAGLKTIY